MRTRLLVFSLLAVLVACLLAAFVYNLPPIHERLSWRVANLRVQIKYALNPPEQVVFVPQEQQDLIETIVQSTLQALTPSPANEMEPSPTPSPDPTLTPTNPLPTATPEPSPTPTATPTPLPEAVQLAGIVHEYQKFNNCGPATLSMALSYWGWQGDQFVTRAYLRPSYEIDDKNVNPSEMVDFVETQTGLKALARVAGDLDLLKRFTAAGYPVIIERGLQKPDEYWLGHYQIISGYDDPQDRLIVHDSFLGPGRGYPIPAQEVVTFWPHFNNVYVLIYPPEREAEVMAMLGPHADETYNHQYAVQKAMEETAHLSGRDLFFAWFNIGASLAALGDYAGAADAFDYAFTITFNDIPSSDRPWRTMWYRFGPYQAYYHTGRYQDVIDLAYTTLINVDKPVLEETYYWRGLAKEGLGDLEGAIADLRRAANLNPRSTNAVAELQRLGVEAP